LKVALNLAASVLGLAGDGDNVSHAAASSADAKHSEIKLVRESSLRTIYLQRANAPAGARFLA